MALGYRSAASLAAAPGRGGKEFDATEVPPPPLLFFACATWLSLHPSTQARCMRKFMSR